ncbi:Uncharacterized deoxyribonuclease YjjV [Kingella potus]|uniref:Uncharacterized deoxyribonuclease YjjV n=1 Tax=Kingella potus TaxID=265175 RepID=A0A377R316_9NEIS|nr:TatD family hydrolase [Kingella potus]STR02649.1 Uncharacterized deoxyribonuclease YjjV [Kingella potus]
MFTDTHTHLAEPPLAGRLPEILAEAAAAGVTRFFVPSARRADWPAVSALADARIVPAFGIHPWFAAEEGGTDDWQALEELLRRHPQAMLGETGLDYLHTADETQRQRQRECLSAQLDLASRHRRPVLLHNVRAGADLLHLLRQHGIRRGIVHAFSGSMEEARLFAAQGMKIGIGVLVLNPNAKKARRAAAELPLSALVLETDSPFMAKDAANTPARVRAVAETVCALRGISLAELAAAAESNVAELLDAADFPGCSEKS